MQRVGQQKDEHVIVYGGHIEYCKKVVEML